MAFFSDNFDDILFEGRNKTYGAFEMRRKYYRQLIISASASFLVFVLIFLVPYLIINRPEKALKQSPYYTEYISSQPVDIIPPEDELLPELIRLQKKAAYTVPQVVTNVDDQALSDLNNDTEESDTTTQGNNTDGSTHGVLDGEGADNDAIYTYVQELPSFPGGEQALKSFLQRNIRYPKLAIDNRIQGKVYVSFMVEKDGTFTNLKVIQGIGAGCDDEALRVVSKMPRWKPGKRQGHEDSFQIMMPVIFILPSR